MRMYSAALSRGAYPFSCGWTLKINNWSALKPLSTR